MSLTPVLVKKGPNSNITYKNGNKRIKVAIYTNFEVNMLTSKCMFHKFCNFNPSSYVIIAEIVSHIAYIVRSVIEG